MCWSLLGPLFIKLMNLARCRILLSKDNIHIVFGVNIISAASFSVPFTFSMCNFHAQSITYTDVSLFKKTSSDNMILCYMVI